MDNDINSQLIQSSQSSNYRQAHKRKLLVFGLVIFLSGVGIGSGVIMTALQYYGVINFQYPERTAIGRITNGLERDLDLTAEQRALIDPIIEKHVNSLDRLYLQFSPEIEKEIASLKANVARELTEEQKIRWVHRFNEIEEGISHSEHEGEHREESDQDVIKRY